VTFEQALEHVLQFEGGYVDNPDDPGGATNFGITQAVYDDWRMDHGRLPRPVLEIEPEEVRQIYRERYWEAARCEDLPPEIRLLHFDAAVNCGVKNAAKFLQRALGVPVDGIIGPITLGAVQKREIRDLANDLLWERVRYYRDISARRRPDRRDLWVFLPGWLYRVLKLRDLTRDPRPLL